MGGGDGSFPFAAFVQMPGLFASQLKKMLHLLVALKRKKKLNKKQKCNLISAM